MTHVQSLAFRLLAASALSMIALGAQASEPPKTCVVVGKEVPASADAPCPGDILATLRSYSYEYQVEKRDEKGNRVFDEKTQQPVMETKVETFGLMAALLEQAGLTEQMTRGTATVFAVPDSVLQEALPAWQVALRDKDAAADAVAAVAMHAVDEPIRRGWFASSNGKVWTLAGGSKSGAKPIEFHDLTPGGSLKINGVPVGNADVEAANGLIHVVAAPLAMPKKSEKVAQIQ